MQTYFARALKDSLDSAEYVSDLPDITPEGGMQAEVLSPVLIWRFLHGCCVICVMRMAGGMIADQFSAYHDLLNNSVVLDEAMIKIRDNDNPVKVLASHHPQSNWYIALKLELAALDAMETSAVLSVEPDTLIHSGETNTELPKVIHLLRTRILQAFLKKFHDVLEKYQDATIYAAELEPAVKTYQKLAGKVTDGITDPVTVAALQEEALPVRRFASPLCNGTAVLAAA